MIWAVWFFSGAIIALITNTILIIMFRKLQIAGIFLSFFVALAVIIASILLMSGLQLVGVF